MDATTLDALRITLQVATAATLVVLPPGLLLAYLLARREFPGKSVVSTVVALPLVMPPTAIGFLVLRLLANDGLLGRQSLGFDLDILLTWKAAVLASAIMATPLVVRTAQVSFEAVDPRLEMMARTLGHGRLSVFVRFTLPLAARGLIAAAILGFTRAIGEFGATVILAGNIPGRTQTLALAIFFEQQAGKDKAAYVLLAVSLVLGFTAILVSEHLVRRRRGQGPAR